MRPSLPRPRHARLLPLVLLAGGAPLLFAEPPAPTPPPPPAPAAAPASPSTSKAADLRWRWTAGVPVRYRLTTEILQKVTGGMEMEVAQLITFDYSLLPGPVTDGAMKLTITFDTAKMKIASPNLGEGGVDSTVKDAPADPSPLVQLLKPLLMFVGESIELTIDSATGSVKSVKGSEAIFTKIQNHYKDDPQTAASLGQFKQMLSDEALKRTWEVGLGVIPGKTVGVGQSWDVNFSQSMAPLGTLSLIAHSTLAELDPGAQIARIETTTTAAHQPQKDLPADAPVFAMKSSKASQTTLFNVTRGLIEESSSMTDMEWTITVPGGQPPMVQNIRQKVDMKLLPGAAPAATTPPPTNTPSPAPHESPK